jgi:hypothetical protein
MSEIECMICGDDDVQESVSSKCPKCNIDICHVCMKKWLITDESEPRCCNGECHIHWTRRFLACELGINFVNGELQKHRNKMVIARVKATNSNVAKEAKQRKKDAKIEGIISLLGRKINGVDVKIDKCRKIYNKKLKNGTDHRDESMIKLSVERSELETQRERYMNGQMNYKTEYKRYKKARENNGAGGDADETGGGADETGGGADETGGGVGKSNKPIYHVPCPQESCNGFLSKKGLCHICETQVCSKCQIIIEIPVKDNNGKQFGSKAIKNVRKKAINEHICKKEDIETVKSLKTETMGCPRCRARIYKIQGCDQMYCTVCEKNGNITVFSWKTGKIDNGRIHNPHYIEYLRRQDKNTREVGDVYCGGLPNIISVINKFRNMGFESGPILRHHITLTEFLEYNVNPLRQKVRDMDIHRETQILYVAGLIDENTFERRVCMTEKKHELDKEILDIYEVILKILTELFIDTFNTITAESYITVLDKYINNIYQFLNDENKCCDELSCIYKLKVPYGIVFEKGMLIRK